MNLVSRNLRNLPPVLKDLYRQRINTYREELERLKRDSEHNLRKAWVFVGILFTCILRLTAILFYNHARQGDFPCALPFLRLWLLAYGETDSHVSRSAK